MPRKSGERGGGGGQPFSSSTSRSSHQKGNQKRKQRGLNAFAIATAQDPDHHKVKAHRLGVAEDDSGHRGGKRRRMDEDDEEDEQEDGPSEPRRRQQKKVKKGESDDLNVSEGSDSEGNEWKMGHVDADDDEDIDSDEAFDESDEERYEGFMFRGSSANKKKPAKKRKSDSYGDVNLDEESAVEDEEDDESLGEDAVDLATMLDDDYQSESVHSNDDTISSKKTDSHKLRQADETSEESDAESDDADDSDGFGFSDEEDDEQDHDAKLDQLQGLVRSLPRVEDDGDEDETSAQDAQANRNRLLNALKGMANLDPAFSRSAKRLAQSNEATQTGQNDRLVKVPLPRRQQDKIDRAAAYSKAKETLNRWIDTVKQNRRAEHLSFPLHDPDIQEAAGTTRLLQTGDGAPRNDLEDAIQTILQESGLGVKGGKDAEEQVRKAEELTTKDLPVAEVMARQAELRRHRELLFREELRSKRISKIKSKAYRRVHRKDQERAAEKERQALADAGLQDSEEERERNDRRRAEERMGARHKESKWAKGMKASGRSTWDDDARSGITDMARRNEELRRRMEGRKVKNDDDESAGLSDDGSDDDEEDGFQLRDALDRDQAATAEQTRLSSMAFMKKADLARKKQNDDAVRAMRRELGDDVEDDEEEDMETNIGRRMFGPSDDAQATAFVEPRKRGELEEASDSDDDGAALVRSEPVETAEPEEASESINKPHQDRTARKLTRTSDTRLRVAGASQRKGSDDGLNDEANAVKPSNVIRNPNVPDSKLSRQRGKMQRTVLAGSKDGLAAASDPDHEVEDTLIPSNLALVEAAFAGDDVEDQFQQEKKTAADDEDDQYEDTSMPGWGSWTGQDLKSHKKRAPKKRLVKKQQGVKAANRKDANLDRVILSEKRVKKNVKYLAPQLPHPFESKQQYERSLRVPVGPEWTTKETFQNSTKPRIMVKQGIIRPMHKPLV